MRRRLPWLVLPAALLFTPPAAHAGPGAILKGLAKLGKAGAKAGKAGKLAKGTAALKGAKTLGAVGAAEAVFRHTPTSGARVGLFVADDGAGALKVVTESGEQLSHSADELGRMVDDLDQMAKVTPEAGVDLFVDPDALHRLGDLKLGENTRLFLANVDGRSLPIRHVASGGHEIALAVDGTGAGRFWLRLTTEAAEVALRLAMAPDDQARLVVADGECAPMAGVDEVASDPSALLHDADATVVLLTETEPSAVLMADAQRVGVDLVAIHLDVCVDASEPVPQAMAAIGRKQAAQTVADHWALAANAEQPTQVTEVHERGDWLDVVGPGFRATHRISAALPDDDEPPLWLTLTVGFLALIGAGWWYWPRKED